MVVMVVVVVMVMVVVVVMVVMVSWLLRVLHHNISDVIQTHFL